MLNRIILIGRLTRDPEAKYIPSGIPVTTFSIAVDRPQSANARQEGAQKETDFIDIVTWRQTAEFAANYLQKGRLVAIEGKLQIRSYQTQDGQNRKAAEVVADNVRPLDRAPEREGDGDQGGQSQGGYGNGGQQRPQGAPAPGSADHYRQAAAPPPGYQRQPPPQGNRPPARNQPPASASNYDDNDDLTDPFAE